MRQTGPDRRDAEAPLEGAASALTWRLLFARFALLWERAVPALAPAATIACAFAAVVLFDLLPRLPVAALRLALVLLAAGFAWAR